MLYQPGVMLWRPATACERALSGRSACCVVCIYVRTACIAVGSKQLVATASEVTNRS